MFSHSSLRSSRGGAGAAALLIGTAGLLVAATPAYAAGASVRVVNGVLTFQAGSGEENSLRITADQSLNVHVVDAVPLTAGAGCRAVDNPNAVTCSYPRSVRISTGDKNDVVSLLMGLPSVVDAGADDDRVGVGGSILETEPTHTLIGGPGNDVLAGGHGADLIDGGPGRDVMTGGNNEHDIVDYSSRTARVVADLDGAQEDDGEANERDTIGDGVEGIRGGSAGDTLTGNAERNELAGNGGPDTLFGNQEGDELTGGTGDDTIHGGPGGDTISDSSGHNRIFGHGDDDRIDLSGWNESGGATVDGGSGNDTITNGWSTDTLDGGPDVDEIVYGSIDGGVQINLSRTRPENGKQGENDTLLRFENVTVGSAGTTGNGRNGTNKVVGNDGPNLIRASWADDELYGYDGNDVILPGYGNDTVYGNDGDDRIVDTGRAPANTPHNVTYDDEIQGGFGKDYIDGAHGDDYIRGNENDDTLVGGDGVDRMFGYTGKDDLSAGRYHVTDAPREDEDRLDCGGDQDTYWRTGNNADLTSCEVRGS
jgi:Ca2+-binding RTX toxin-like protein